MQDLSAFSARPRLAALLDHFAKVKDTRQACKVMYPLREVLFLVVCGTIASGDDYDDIVDWGQAHLAFLRGFAEFHFAIPCADWLRCIMNRIDPGLFRDCFTAWVAECWPDKLDLVAIDGKTSRRTHNRRTGDKALHLVSAFATNSRLVLGQEAVFEKSNEITAIPALIERLDLVGALVSIDAMGCQVAIAQSTLDAGADYLLAVKDNQPTLHAEIESYFATAPAAEVEKAETIGKDHGRFELRNYSVSHQVVVCGRTLLSGRPALSPTHHHRHRREPHRTRRHHPNRTAILYLLAHTFGSGLCRSGARSLGDRKHTALGSRRHLPRGPVTPADRSWCQEHGGGAPLRPQPRPPSLR
jgi:predicted transposase YbfD/YdcC